MKAATFRAFHGGSIPGAEQFATLDPVATDVDALDGASFDVPAWVEAMHRTRRKRTLCYVVRSRGGRKGDGVSLRTGSDFSKVFRIREEKVRDARASNFVQTPRDAAWS